MRIPISNWKVIGNGNWYWISSFHITIFYRFNKVTSQITIKVVCQDLADAEISKSRCFLKHTFKIVPKLF